MFNNLGNIVDSKFARSNLLGRLKPDGNFYLDWYETSVSGRGIGTEMISRAIETVGPQNVSSVSARLGLTNLKVYENAIQMGADRIKAVWQTPLGKSMKSLGYKAVEVSNGNVKFTY